ncbi:MAG: hypothetical protein PUB37_07335 [Firmicutes bacterium]|nr:hypothetical protein [Bacillota bacterium]
MIFSPYHIIIAIGCFACAALMFTKLRKATPVSIPVGILAALGGIYILCREFIKGFADSEITSWAARGVLVVFLVYMLLSYNNVRAEQKAEFDEPQDGGKSIDGEEADESEDENNE